MQPSDIKRYMSEDLNTIKYLDLDIMPAKSYYGALLFAWVVLFYVIFGIQISVCLFWQAQGVWDIQMEKRYSDHEFRTLETAESRFDEKMNDLDLDVRSKHPNLSEKAYAALEKKELERRHAIAKKERDEKKRQFIEQAKGEDRLNQFMMCAGTYLSSVIISFIMLLIVKNYVIFNYQIRPKLKTGNYLHQKAKTLFVAFAVVFSVFSFIFIPFHDQIHLFFAGIISILFTGFALAFGVSFESSRIGISVLSTAITDFFEKNKRKRS